MKRSWPRFWRSQLSLWLCALLALAMVAAVDWQLALYAQRFDSGFWLFAADLVTFASLAVIIVTLGWDASRRRR